MGTDVHRAETQNSSRPEILSAPPAHGGPCAPPQRGWGRLEDRLCRCPTPSGETAPAEACLQGVDPPRHRAALSWTLCGLRRPAWARLRQSCACGDGRSLLPDQGPFSPSCCPRRACLPWTLNRFPPASHRGFQSRVCPARGGPSRKSALVPRAVLAPEQEVRQLKLFTQVLSRLRRAPH